MKTAAEMRALNPKFTVQNVLAEIEKSIEAVNQQGQLEIRLTVATTHADRFDWTRDWITGTDRPMIESIVGELRAAGYKVTELYEERQFVDMDIIISWAE